MEHGHVGLQEMHYVVQILGQSSYFLIQVVHLRKKKKINTVCVLIISFSIFYQFVSHLFV